MTTIERARQASVPSSERARQPALDGVRAIAIAAVMIYHGFIGWADGGFFGVDLFFVLSGYLITGLLIDEQRRSGAIDLRQFWLRRARRLLPALALLLVWVAIYAAWIAEREQLIQLRRDALATLFYIANWTFIFDGGSYFDQFGTPSPLRHTWSLAIEEQWYLLWPLIVTLAIRLAWGRRAAVAALVAAIVASALAMAALANGAADASRAYYGTDTRAQGLLVGALLALLLPARPGAAGADPTGTSGDEAVPFQRAIAGIGYVSIAGFIALVIAANDSDRWIYSGGFLLAALASAGVVAAAATPSGANLLHVFLASEPLPAIGRISYGLYLWHWPIYVFLTPDRVELEGSALFGLRVAVTFVVSTICYLLVERPVRSFAAFSPRDQLAAGAIGVATTALVVILATANGAAPRPSLDDGPVAAVGEGGPLRVLVVGDSVYLDLAVNFNGPLRPDVDLHSSAVLGCGVIDLPGSDNCDGLHESWRAELDTFDPEVVMIPASVWDLIDRETDTGRLEFASAPFERFVVTELDRAIEILTERGATPILVTLPCLDPVDSALGVDELEDVDQERVGWLNDVFRRYAVEHPGVSLIEPALLTCPTGIYEATIGGVRLHRDGVHYTDEAIPAMWEWFIPQLQAFAGRTTTEPATPLPTPNSAPRLGADYLQTLLVGDETLASLAAAPPPDDPNRTQVEIRGALEPGCSILPGQPLTEDAPATATQACAGRADRWASAAEAFGPDVVLLAATPYELLDHRADGADLVFGSEPFRQYLRTSLDQWLRRTRRWGSSLALLTLPCLPPDLDPGSASEWADAARVVWLNAALRDWAAEHPRVVLIDVASAICPGGVYAATFEQVPLHPDDRTVGREAAAELWDWLLPQLGPLERDAS